MLEAIICNFGAAATLDSIPARICAETHATVQRLLVVGVAVCHARLSEQ